MRNILGHNINIGIHYCKGKGKRIGIQRLVVRTSPLIAIGLRCGSHSFTCKHTTPAFAARSSPEGVTTGREDERLSWPCWLTYTQRTVYPYKCLPVNCRSGACRPVKVRRSETDVLPVPCTQPTIYVMYGTLDGRRVVTFRTVLSAHGVAKCPAPTHPWDIFVGVGS